MSSWQFKWVALTGALSSLAAGVMSAPVAAPLAGGVLALSATGCGPSCGNGELEDGEACDDGNSNELDTCRSCVFFNIPQTTVKWSFNANPDVGFSNDGCFDVGATTMRIELVGPAAAMRNVDKDCSGRQAVFEDLPPGTYQGTMTPLTADGASLVVEPVAFTFLATTASQTIDVVVPYTAWTTAYTGTFFFRLTWDDTVCAEATPPVVTQLLTLKVGGTTVTQMTDNGQSLNGSDPLACVTTAVNDPEFVRNVPFGPATFQVVGLDGDGLTAFDQTFDTFVGAGISNPVLTFALDNVELTPDAMPADADLPDAL